MICPECRSPVPRGAVTCPSCGRPLPEGDETLHISGRTPPSEDHTLLAFRDAGAESSGGWSLPAAEPAGVTRFAGALEPGLRLGQRYQILKRLGEGGMGAVYQTQDLELDRVVALKVIRPELARDPEILQRFKQEIILARQVTHRNVVRIFDLGQAEGIKFISMEFVPGQDLQGLLEEKGKLPVEKAVAILEQVCLALDEAHQEGVVHRDLKPRNIMIDDQGRVVVMDFGIARSVQVTSMTHTGSLIGTPDYMSPEQVKGEQVDARSDIFALGVILYQLLSGALPYQADSAMAAMYKRTQERARPLREANPEVPAFLSDVVARCLEISPPRRYQSARELLHDLELFRGGTPRTIVGTIRALRPVRPRTGQRLAMAGVAAAALIAIALAALLLRPRAEVPAPVAAPGELVSLAILPFRNASGAAELEWLSHGLADMLGTDVGQSAELHTVAPERLQQVLTDLRVPAGSSLDASTRRRVAEFADAERLVFGQYAKLGEQIRIDATVEDVEGQRTVPIKVEARSEGELLRAVEELAGLIRENLELSREDVRALRARAFRPSSDSIAAMRAYTEGLEQLRAGNNLDAVQRFEAAVAEDPAFALAHSRLALAHDLLGHDREAEAGSRRAVELSERLPDEERSMIAAAHARITSDLEGGVEAYQSLLARRPHDPVLHYELGVLYEHEGMFDRAQEHYARTLEADPRDLRALLASGRALTIQGNGEAAIKPLQSALALAGELGSQEVESSALLSLGLAYRSLDRLADARSSFDRALEIKRSLGELRGAAAAVDGIASVQALSGEYGEARRSYEETISIWREVGDQRGVGIGLMNLGDLERTRGNYEESLRLTREALQIQIDIDDEFNQGLSLNNIGAIYYLQGMYEDALVYYQRALDLRQRRDVPGEVADTLHNLGETYATMGLLDRALDHYLKALDLRRKSGDTRGAALESQYLAKVFTAQGRYRAALGAVEEAAQTLRELEDRSSFLTETVAWQGHVLALLGRSEEAAPLLSEALELARGQQDRWLVAQILGFEAGRLFGGDDLKAAAAAYGEALSAARESGDPLLELGARIGAARLEIEKGSGRGAVPKLRAALEEARRLGTRALAAEASVHLGAALVASGDTASAREVLNAAVRETEAIGSLPLQAQAHHHLSAALAAQGDAEGASEHARAATELLQQMLRESGSESLRDRRDLRGIAPPNGSGGA